ncbi:MAG: hypothetical protein ACYDA2_08500 [Acidimicrobiales bacterium]
MDEAALDPQEILERIRNDHRSLKWEPLAPSDSLARWHQRPMRDEESLEYLHGHWALPDAPDPAVGGSGLRGRVVRAFGRLVFRVLGPYLRSERELVSRLVRMNDALAHRCDELAEEIARRQVANAENDARLAAWLQALADDAER